MGLRRRSVGAVVSGLAYRWRLAVVALGGFLAAALWNVQHTYSLGGPIVPAYAVARACGAGIGGALLAVAVAMLLLRRMPR